jgi:hypothetical protein
MGGLGSGRWHRWQAKDTLERHFCLDIRAWQHRKFLRPDLGFSWGWWTHKGSHVAAVHVQVQEAQVVLTYVLRPGGEGERAIEAPVALTWTPCHYGGQRPWFICPGEGCQRRVAILYGAGRDFLCRHCYDLVYDSQRQDRPTRLIAKAQQIRRRLGGSASLMAPFPRSRPACTGGRISGGGRPRLPPRRPVWRRAWRSSSVGTPASWRATRARRTDAERRSWPRSVRLPRLRRARVVAVRAPPWREERRGRGSRLRAHPQALWCHQATNAIRRTNTWPFP